MSRFFEIGGTNNDWINLDHVLHIRQRWSRTAHETTTTFELTDGTTYETIQPLDPRGWSSSFVPAAPGTFCIGVFADVDPDTRPTECHACHEPVVAWAIPPDNDDQHWPTPVFLEPTSSNQENFYPLPDGKYRSIADREYDSIDDVKQTVLARAQEAWDRTHGRGAAQRENTRASA